MAGEDCDDRDRLRSTLRRLRQEEDEEERPDPPQRNNAGERETENMEGVPRPLLFQLSQSMDQMDNVFELTPSANSPSSSFDNNPPALPPASASNNTLPSSLSSSSNSTSRGHGPIFDIASFMEESRQRQQARDREETEAAEENALRLRTIRHTMVVPGESTSSPSSDQLSEEECYSLTRRRRRRKSVTGSDDQIVSNVPHPLSITHSHTLREASLNCPSTTDSEPDQLAPGSKYESTKYQRVPSMKKHVLEKQRRELEQTQQCVEKSVEKISSSTRLWATPPSSQDSRTTGSSDYIASAQSGLSCSLESTSSTTVQSTNEEGSQDADSRSHGLFKFKGRIVTKFDNNSSDRGPITDTEIIDSDDTIGETHTEEGTQDLFSANNHANDDSQYERTNTIPRWMLQQQKEQESEQTDIEELTEETVQGGGKRSRLDSSPSSGTDPALSPTMKPPSKRPAGQIQSDSSNESTAAGSKGLKLAVTTSSIKSPTSSIELSSSYSQSISSTLQSVSSGYMPSGSSLTSSSDIVSSSLSTPPVDLPCVGPVTDSEGETTDLNFTIMSKSLSDFDTMATSSNSNNNNNDKETSTTTTTTTNTNGSTSDSSSNRKDDKAREKRGGNEEERNDKGGGGGGGDSKERGDMSEQHGEQTDRETKIVEESELLGTDYQGSSGEDLRQLPSLNMEDTTTTANNATSEQLKLSKGQADNSIITIDDTNNDKDGSEFTESLTNDSCIIIRKESLTDSLQPSLTIDSPNLLLSPEREDKAQSMDTGSFLSPPLLTNDSKIDSAHTLEGNCTDTSAGTQNSFCLHVSPSQSAIEPNDSTDVLVIGSSTESTKGDVLSHSSLKLSSDSIPGITPPVPVYESLQLSNTEVSSSTNSVILSTSPVSNVIATSQADVSQTNSSGTFDFRLPDSDMLLPNHDTTEEHVEDMQIDTIDNNQSAKEQVGGDGIAETRGRSPGKCLSLRRRRSMSSGENTPKKLKQDENQSTAQSTAKATDASHTDTTIDPTNAVKNDGGNKEIETRIAEEGDRTGSTHNIDQSKKSSTTKKPTASLRTTGFMLGLTEEEGDSCDAFNDSSHFELPLISALNSESEVSPSDISFTKPDGICATSTGTSLPLAAPSSLFAGLQHTRRKDTRRIDPYEFQEEDSNTNTPLFMPLRRRQEPPSSLLNNAMESENPLPLSTAEECTQDKRPVDETEEDREVTVTSTPVRSETNVVSNSTSQAQYQQLVNLSTPLTAPSNVSTIASPSPHFVSPISCLTPQGLKDICSSNPYSPLIRLRHSTTVITSHVFIRDEIIDRNTEKVIETLDHLVGPSEERKVSIESGPLSPAHVVHTIPTQQSSSSHVSVTPTLCPANIQSTSFISHAPVNVTGGGGSAYGQPLEQSISPLSAAASSHVVNSSCTEYHFTPSTSIISSEGRSESTTPTSRRRPRSPLRSQSLELDSSLPSTSQCTTSSVIKNKAHQSGFKLVENQKVIARWKDGKWYAATIVEASPIKAYLHFYDGDYSSVFVQHILPLACIPQGVQVSSADTDISGSLLDFSIPDSTFRMKLSNETIMKCSLEDLVMTADTAEMTLQLLNTQSKQIVKKRKKSVSKRPEKAKLSHRESILFSGMIFLVTDHRSSEPTGREEIEQILRDRGGYIMDEYKPSLVIDNRTFCLSNTFCRTLKYLTAIAVSLPCVSYNWIMECVKQVKIVNWEKDFSLSAGVSPLTKELIKWQSHAKGFLKVNVFLSGSRTFKEIWQKVISCGGGHVISKLPRKSSKESQFIIVSESSSTPVSLKDFLVVSQEWLVECLLAGKVVSTGPFKRS